MKKISFNLFLLAACLGLNFITSCSSPKAFYSFQPGPATPKVAKLAPPPAEPVFTASTNSTVTTLPVTAPLVKEEKGVATTISKKEMRKLIKKTLKDLRDTAKTRSREKRIAVSADKNKLEQLQAEARELKNSVQVQNNDNKVVVDVKKPSTSFSQTELILIGIAAFLVLVLLFAIPVIGPILAAVLGLAVIAAALAVVLGYIQINV